MEPVDKSGSFSSIVVDDQSNLHMSYISRQEGVKYAFRPAGSGRWFTTVIGRAGDGYTDITLDPLSNPTICFTGYELLTFAHYENGEWKTQEVGNTFGVISFSCSIAVAPDGTPHLTWYQYYDRERNLYLHLKHAVLRDNAWMARTVDYDGETGKWNSLFLDATGNPHIAYSAWRHGHLKYASWNGRRWNISIIDSRERNAGAGNPGIANSLVLNAKQVPQVSYFDDLALKFAYRQDNDWKIEVVDSLSPVLGAGWSTSRSTLLLDSQGNPHIIYGDYSALKHAYREGGRWHIALIARGGGGLYKFSAAAMDRDGTIYVCFEDPADESLQVAIGHRSKSQQTAAGAKEDSH